MLECGYQTGCLGILGLSSPHRSRDQTDINATRPQHRTKARIYTHPRHQRQHRRIPHTDTSAARFKLQPRLSPDSSILQIDRKLVGDGTLGRNRHSQAQPHIISFGITTVAADSELVYSSYYYYRLPGLTLPHLFFLPFTTLTLHPATRNSHRRPRATCPLSQGPGDADKPVAHTHTHTHTYTHASSRLITSSTNLPVRDSPSKASTTSPPQPALDRGHPLFLRISASKGQPFPTKVSSLAFESGPDPATST